MEKTYSILYQDGEYRIATGSGENPKIIATAVAVLERLRDNVNPKARIQSVFYRDGWFEFSFPGTGIEGDVQLFNTPVETGWGEVLSRHGVELGDPYPYPW